MSKMVKVESEEDMHPVTLRSVTPGIPENSTKKHQLDEDLQ